MKKEFKWKVFLICLLILVGISLIGSLFTSSNVNTDWYDSVKSSITPPDFVFPIVWTILYLLIAIALYFVWISANKKQKKLVVLIFGANFIFNILWSYLFFTLQNPVIALVDLIFIWLSILMMIQLSWKINRKAGYLLIPYFLWVSFAGLLNYLIVMSL